MKKLLAMGMVVCCITLLLSGGVSAEEKGEVISLQQEAEEQLQKELGAFEITANQRELAKNNEAGYSVLDAGRGNPNWINTQARYAFTRFSDFATRECEPVKQRPCRTRRHNAEDGGFCPIRTNRGKEN